jgi:hypothetical protein
VYLACRDGAETSDFLNPAALDEPAIISGGRDVRPVAAVFSVAGRWRDALDKPPADL